MLAWKVDDEEISAIVFAATEEEASRIGANELFSDDESVEVVRSPEYDQYAHQGYVPTKVLYDDYWWFECSNCQCRVSLSDEEDDDGNPIDPVFEEKRLFCSAACQEDLRALVAQAGQDKEEAKSDLLAMLPGIEIKSCTGGGDYIVAIELTFPGGRFPVTWTSELRRVFLVNEADMEAWNAFSSVTKLP